MDIEYLPVVELCITKSTLLCLYFDLLKIIHTLCHSNCYGIV